jgi:hypothetical protein
MGEAASVASGGVALTLRGLRQTKPARRVNWIDFCRPTPQPPEESNRTGTRLPATLTLVAPGDPKPPELTERRPLAGWRLVSGGFDNRCSSTRAGRRLRPGHLNSNVVPPCPTTDGRLSVG